MRLAWAAAALIVWTGAVYVAGGQHRATAMQLEIARAQEAAREAFAKLDAVRLASEARLALQLQSQEDEARAQPVTHDQCLPAERVRRLDRLQ